MHFRMERQQLRHDEQMAKRKIEERDRIEDVFRVVYGEVAKDDLSKDLSGSSEVTPGTGLSTNTPIIEEDTAVEMQSSSKKKLNPF